jgi:hypothetical protein
MMKLALTSLVMMFVAVAAQEEKPQFPGPMNGQDGWTMGDAVPQIVSFMQALAAPGAEPAIGAFAAYELPESFDEYYGDENGWGFKVASIAYNDEKQTLYSTFLVKEDERCKALFSITCPIVAYTDEEKATGLVDAKPEIVFVGDNTKCEEQDFQVLRVDKCNAESPVYSPEECDRR